MILGHRAQAQLQTPPLYGACRTQLIFAFLSPLMFLTLSLSFPLSGEKKFEKQLWSLDFYSNFHISTFFEKKGFAEIVKSFQNEQLRNIFRGDQLAN